MPTLTDAPAPTPATVPTDHPLAREAIRIGTLVQGREHPVRTIETLLGLGFESFQLFFWQTVEGVDLRQLARETAAVLRGTGVTISSLGIFGNPLERRPKDLETLASWGACIEAAPWFGCDLVAGFAGRLLDKPVDQSIPAFAATFTPLARQAKANGVRLAFENCDMGGTWGGGDWNLAHAPEAWDLMFDAIPLDNIGLEWEPCHQIVSLIDPVPQLKKYVKRIFHVHGKDAHVHWDVLKTYGLRGTKTWVEHRTPGFGDSNWVELITELRRGGFRGSIDIEGWHDPVYRHELEMTGQVSGLHYLQRCRGGRFVPNP